MFVPGSDPPTVGERVTVEVVFQGGPRVLLHGVVLWRRTTGDARARPGAGVGIDGAEQAKLRYLLGYVRGGLIDVRERRRLPVRLRVAYTGAEGRAASTSRATSTKRARSSAPPRCSTSARRRCSLISPPGGDYGPSRCAATVTRQHSQGNDRGVGVRFDFRDEQERARWGAFVREARERLPRRPPRRRRAPVASLQRREHCRIYASVASACRSADTPAWIACTAARLASPSPCRRASHSTSS